MIIKVNDSIVPPRETKWAVMTATGGVDLFLQDVKQEKIGCCVQMTHTEAYELAMQLLEKGGQHVNRN